MSHACRKSGVGRRFSSAVLACAMLVAMAATGCQTSAPPIRTPSAQIDPCAERLHDVCGRLLLYSSIHGNLPEKIDDLKGVDSRPLPPLACPVSDKPYIYNKDGLRVPGRAGVLVLYDAEPAHSGMRWGILAELAGPGQPLSARVILLPESPVFGAAKP